MIPIYDGKFIAMFIKEWTGMAEEGEASSEDGAVCEEEGLRLLLVVALRVLVATGIGCWQQNNDKGCQK